MEPQATFSTCFGGPFMALDPSVYASFLGEKIATHNVKVWLVNTGWTGGPYGTGHRMEIGHTKAMLRAALSGKLDGVGMRVDPVFGLRVPGSCPDVPPEVLTRGRRGRIARRMTRRRGSWPDVPRELRPVRRSGDARGPGRGFPQTGLTNRVRTPFGPLLPPSRQPQEHQGIRESPCAFSALLFNSSDASSHGVARVLWHRH